jgi:hypothetical protein
LLLRMMGPAGVAMLRVLGQDAPEMLPDVDQQMIGTPAAQRAHMALRERICPE